MKSQNLFAFNWDGTHEIEMRVSEDADDRSQGHVVRIIHFLINGPK